MKRGSGRLAGAIAAVVVAILTLVLVDSRTLEPDRLAENARHISPATFYYLVAQSGRRIGAASSAVDTSNGEISATDIVEVRTVINGDSQSVAASSRAYLSRAFALDSFAFAVGGDQHFNLHGRPAARSGVLVPTLAPMALMLSRSPRPGRADTRWIFNPLAQDVERITLSVGHDSLFQLTDSARYDAALGRWVAAYSDTVRAWPVATPTASVRAWVDRQGRIVSASEPGGLSITRTAFEIAKEAPAPRTP